MKDLVWYAPNGAEMTEAEWRAATLHALGLRLCGEAMDDVNARGEPITGDTLLILLNTAPEPARFVLPDAHPGIRWEGLVDTSDPREPPRRVLREIGAAVSLPPRSLQLFRATSEPARPAT